VIRRGLVLVGLYAAVVVATGLMSGHPVRPLFDGAGATTPYRWIRPPWYVGSTNIKPTPGHTDIAFDNGASPLTGVNSADSQIILNLPRGALPTHGADTAVRVSFTPLDPKKLGSTPNGTRPDGNAYRVEMTYQPSGAPVPTTSQSGNVIMVVPDEAEKMLFSLDGKEWDELPSHMLGDPNTVGSAFNKAGYYLVDTTLPEFQNPNQGSSTKRVVGIVLVVVAAALLLGYVGPNALRRSRAAQARATGRGRSGSAGHRGRSGSGGKPGRTRQVKRRSR
jgi:hypothetical protein